VNTLMKIELEFMRAVTSPVSRVGGRRHLRIVDTNVTGYTVTSQKSVILTLINLRVARFEASPRCICGLLSSG
jgi:hypothetical protein